MEIFLVTTIVAAFIAWAGSYLPAIAFAATAVIAFANGEISNLIDLAALAAIFGSFLAYNRIKTALTASEAAGNAWHEECEAAKTRAERATEELKASEKERLALVAKVAVLEQRPDLGKLEVAITSLAETASTRLETLTEATVTHEKNAEARSHRIVDAIKEINAPLPKEEA